MIHTGQHFTSQTFIYPGRNWYPKSDAACHFCTYVQRSEGQNMLSPTPCTFFFRLKLSFFFIYFHPVSSVCVRSCNRKLWWHSVILSVILSDALSLYQQSNGLSFCLIGMKFGEEVYHLDGRNKKIWWHSVILSVSLLAVMSLSAVKRQEFLSKWYEIWWRSLSWMAADQFPKILKRASHYTCGFFGEGGRHILSVV